MGRIDLPDLSALSLSEERFELEPEPEPTGVRGPAGSKGALSEFTVNMRLEHALDVGFMLEKRSAFENLYQPGRDDDWINRLLPKDSARQAMGLWARVNTFRVRTLPEIAAGVITEEQVRARYMSYSYQMKMQKYRNLVARMRFWLKSNYDANLSEEIPNMRSQRSMQRLLEVLAEKFPEDPWPQTWPQTRTRLVAGPPSRFSRRFRGERA